jgi:DGQHR domain-containing protein
VTVFKYRGVRAQQSAEHEVVTIAARASDILIFARIDRAGRDREGGLQGFQRPQIASHIREIRDYLRTPDAVLPNPIVVAFVDSLRTREIELGVVEIEIEVTDSPPGFVVDGQQRLTALSGLPDLQFEVFVSILVCKDYEELRRQFVLINSTRPLPKALIYELLPGVTGLPQRLTNRSFAAKLAERLNFDPASSLRGMIYQHTNPAGIIRDTAIQKLVMQSASDGVIREMLPEEQFDRGFILVNEFFAAVQNVFREDWNGHNPKTSRLVHSAGVVALSFVMELLVARDGASTREEFERGLGALKGRTAWTSGYWQFSPNEQVAWNSIENTPRQIMALAQHLVSVVRRASRPSAVGVESGPVRAVKVSA